MVIRYGYLSPDLLPIAVRTRSTFGVSSQKSFYDGLLESVKHEGFRNPIILENNSGLKLTYGESRGWVAIKLGIPVPSFINDMKNEFEDFELITTKEQALSKFKDKPAKFRLGPPILFTFGS